MFYLKEILSASLDVFLESAPFMLLGFFMAGLLKAFVPEDLISKHLTGKGIMPVLKASAFGIPIPLCSCGVVPAAAGLKEKGADKGAVASFMISTPETGVDSISITWALMDPFMTIIRPIGAFITAAITGLLISMRDQTSPEDMFQKFSEPLIISGLGCQGGTCCCSTPKQEEKKGYFNRLKEGMRFGFIDLSDDIGPWFITGVFIAGLISAFLKPEMIEAFIGKGISEMIVMLCLSIPLYVCATASTPIAAALMAKGISPGAALVFLLAGPATNAATVLVTSKILGKRNTAIYVFSIAACAIMLGYGANLFYSLNGMSELLSLIHEKENQAHGLVNFISAIIIGTLMTRALIKRLYQRVSFQ